MNDRDSISQPSCQPNDRIHGHKPALPLNEKSLEKASRLFRALSDVPRLKMLSRLAGGEVCVTELAAAEGESMAVISQRLRVLRSEDLVTRRRSGKHVLYALADQHVLELFSNALAHASEPSAESRSSSIDLGASSPETQKICSNLQGDLPLWQKLTPPTRTIPISTDPTAVTQP